MTEQRTDEGRLAYAMREYTDGGPPAPDPLMLARATVARSRARRSALGRFVPDLARLGLAPALLLLALLATLAVGLVIVGGAPSRPAPPIPPERGVFTPTGRMSESREQPTLTVLQDGRVLVVAGYRHKTSAELFDPASDEFTPAGDMATARWGQTATLLEDGQVLVAGGTQPDVTAAAEVWDPRTQSFTPVGTPAVPRFMATSELLPDGRVLISGGSDLSATDEIWDPHTGDFTQTGPALPGLRPEGAAIGDGRILVVLGRSARIWDPTTGTAGPATTLVTARSGYGLTATLLEDGRVLVVGGEPQGEAGMLPYAEIWDPSTMSFTATGRLTEARSRHSAVLLGDGRVLVVGGNVHWDELSHTAELFELR